MWTVHAPHWLVSQPTWVPVRSRSSRRAWTRSRLGSTSSSRACPIDDERDVFAHGREPPATRAMTGAMAVLLDPLGSPTPGLGPPRRGNRWWHRGRRESSRRWTLACRWGAKVRCESQARSRAPSRGVFGGLSVACSTRSSAVTTAEPASAASSDDTGFVGTARGLWRDERVEIVATILLSMSVVLSAWAAYQATKWSGEQADKYASSGALRAQASSHNTSRRASCRSTSRHSSPGRRQPLRRTRRSPISCGRGSVPSSSPLSTRGGRRVARCAGASGRDSL